MKLFIELFSLRTYSIYSMDKPPIWNYHKKSFSVSSVYEGVGSLGLFTVNASFLNYFI